MSLFSGKWNHTLLKTMVVIVGVQVEAHIPKLIADFDLKWYFPPPLFGWYSLATSQETY